MVRMTCGAVHSTLSARRVDACSNRLRRIPYLLSLATFAFSPACTGAQVEGTRIQRNNAETAAVGKACTRAFTNPVYASLLPKMYAGPGGQYSLAMLNDESRPSKEQIRLLYQIHGEVQKCRKISLDSTVKSHPLYVLAMVE